MIPVMGNGRSSLSDKGLAERGRLVDGRDAGGVERSDGDGDGDGDGDNRMPIAA
ncbi:hypothetical protein [Aeromonas veronii]|uniref:hypothetical protein n=1 Tax=Aeromonas veronii TaxID=654 RepID=UPI0032EE4B55